MTIIAKLFRRDPKDSQKRKTFSLSATLFSSTTFVSRRRRRRRHGAAAKSHHHANTCKPHASLSNHLQYLPQATFFACQAKGRKRAMARPSPLRDEIPESWEDAGGGDVPSNHTSSTMEEMASRLANLNVEAAEFVPSFLRQQPPAASGGGGDGSGSVLSTTTDDAVMDDSQEVFSFEKKKRTLSPNVIKKKHTHRLPNPNFHPYPLRRLVRRERRSCDYWPSEKTRSMLSSLDTSTPASRQLVAT